MNRVGRTTIRYEILYETNKTKLAKGFDLPIRDEHIAKSQAKQLIKYGAKNVRVIKIKEYRKEIDVD